MQIDVWLKEPHISTSYMAGGGKEKNAAHINMLLKFSNKNVVLTSNPA